MTLEELISSINNKDVFELILKKGIVSRNEIEDKLEPDKLVYY